MYIEYYLCGLSFESIYFVRFSVWKGKTSRGKLKSSLTLKSLPPSDDALELNIKRAHFQTAIWKSSLCPDPPQLDPLKVNIAK